MDDSLTERLLINNDGETQDYIKNNKFKDSFQDKRNLVVSVKIKYI
jgi:hypothetical protein